MGIIAVSLVLMDHPRSTIRLNGSRVVSPSGFLSETPLQFLMQSKRHKIIRVSLFRTIYKNEHAVDYENCDRNIILTFISFICIIIARSQYLRFS